MVSIVSVQQRRSKFQLEITMPAYTKTGRVSYKAPSGERCRVGFRRGQSKKDGKSDKTNCVQVRGGTRGGRKRNKITGQFAPNSATGSNIVELD